MKQTAELPEHQTDLDLSNDPSSTLVEIPTSEIPPRYQQRLSTLLQGPSAGFVRSMGIEYTPDGVTIPTSGFSDRLATKGIPTQFDAFPFPEGEADPDVYLKLIASGRFPLGTLSNDFVLHDGVFHGIGFLSMDEKLGGLMKSSAEHALLSGRKDLAEEAIDGIEGISVAGFAVGMNIDEEEIKKALNLNISALANVVAAPLPGGDILEGMRARNRADGIVKASSDLTAGYLEHVEAINSLANAA